MGKLTRIIRRVPAIAARQLFNIWLNGIVASGLVPDHLRWTLLRASGLRVDRAVIDAHVFIGSRKIVIGRGSSINRGVFLDGSAEVVLGERVSIGMNAVVVTGTHELGGPENRAGALASEPVFIGDGAWIGANSVVLPGVTIGRGAVVGSGSVVMKDVPANALVMGNPARLVRRLEDDDPNSARTPASTAAGESSN